MGRTLLDLVRDLNELNDDNLAERVIANIDVRWCLSELQDILEAEQYTLTPPHEWVSVEERLPEDEARQYIEDDLDGIGYLYPCLLTYKSPNTERIHVVRFYYDIIQKWFVNNGGGFAKKVGASLGCRYLHRMTAARRRERYERAHIWD